MSSLTQSINVQGVNKIILEMDFFAKKENAHLLDRNVNTA